MKPQDIENFFATLREANPQPASELEYSSVFELVAAVLLSAQATDVSVNKATKRLFAVAPTPQKMLTLGVAGVEEHIRTIGLYRNKAKNLHETCRILIEQHGGQVPRSREALEALPGVGRGVAESSTTAAGRRARTRIGRIHRLFTLAQRTLGDLAQHLPGAVDDHFGGAE